jgi:branched-chain amino acid transport system permease protein
MSRLASLDRRRLAQAVLVAGLLVYPLFASRFWSVSIGAHSLILGIVALSLIFLAGYGGMVSFAQTAIAGVAAYTTALLTVPKLPQQIVLIPVAPHLPAFLVVPVALLAATGTALLFGLIAVRSTGIYLMMLTVALGVGFFYLAEQNYAIFGGHGGIPEVVSPIGYTSENPALFYYICLFCAGVLYLAVKYLVRTPFGLALQGVRDNPRRMRALGYWVGLHRVAAFGVAGFIAGVGGVLSVWYNGGISPGSVDLTRVLEILIIAVIGGLAFPEGAFIGALAFVLVDTFASSVPTIGIPLLGQFSFRERFNTLIGLTFLLIVLFSPNGLIGIGQRLVSWWSSRRSDTPPPAARAPSGPPVESGTTTPPLVGPASEP